MKTNGLQKMLAVALISLTPNFTFAQSANSINSALTADNAARLCEDGTLIGNYLVRLLIDRNNFPLEDNAAVYAGAESNPQTFFLDLLEGNSPVISSLSVATRQKLAAIRLDLPNWLNSNYARSANSAYRVRPGQPIPQSESTLLRSFLVESGFTVACPAKRQQSQFVSSFRLRGDSATISNQASGAKLAALDAATASIIRDDVANTTAVNTTIIAGFDVTQFMSTPDKKYAFSLVPYVGYQAKNTDPDDSEDIEHASFGIALGLSNITLGSKNYGVGDTLQIAFERGFDKANKSQTSKYSLVWNAAPYYKPKRRLCNSDRVITNDLSFHCTLNALASYIDVSDVGNNTALMLAADNSLLGRGYSIGLSFLPKADTDNWVWLNRWNLSAGYKFIAYNSGNLSNTENSKVTLSFTPNSAKNLEISLEYVNGDNEETFQREDSTSLKLGFRL